MVIYRVIFVHPIEPIIPFVSNEVFFDMGDGANTFSVNFFELEFMAGLEFTEGRINSYWPFFVKGIDSLFDLVFSHATKLGIAGRCNDLC